MDVACPRNTCQLPGQLRWVLLCRHACPKLHRRHIINKHPSCATNRATVCLCRCPPTDSSRSHYISCLLLSSVSAVLAGVAAVTEYTPEMKIAPEWSAILSWASQQPAGKKTSILARPGSSQHAAASLPQDVAGYLQQSQIGLRPADMVLQASVLLARPHSGGLALAAGVLAVSLCTHLRQTACP